MKSPFFTFYLWTHQHLIVYEYSLCYESKRVKILAIISLHSDAFLLTSSKVILSRSSFKWRWMSLPLPAVVSLSSLHSVRSRSVGFCRDLKSHDLFSLQRKKKFLLLASTLNNHVSHPLLRLLSPLHPPLCSGREAVSFVCRCRQSSAACCSGPAPSHTPGCRARNIPMIWYMPVLSV